MEAEAEATVAGYHSISAHEAVMVLDNGESSRLLDSKWAGHYVFIPFRRKPRIIVWKFKLSCELALRDLF